MTPRKRVNEAVLLIQNLVGFGSLKIPTRTCEPTTNFK